MITLTEATDRLAQHASTHVRITHSVKEGKYTLAVDLLFTRMMRFMGDYAEGDILEPADLLAAMATLDHSPGVAMTMEMKQAAIREIDRIRHS